MAPLPPTFFPIPFLVCSLVGNWHCTRSHPDTTDYLNWDCKYKTGTDPDTPTCYATSLKTGNDKTRWHKPQVCVRHTYCLANSRFARLSLESMGMICKAY